MKLSPHVVAETMRKLGSKDRTWREPKSLPVLYALITQAVTFDFGTVHPAMEHKDFALDLYERKLFTLPFPVTAFQFEGVPHPSQYVEGRRAAGALMVVHMSEDRGLSAIMCTEMRHPDGRSKGGIPIGLIMGAKLANPRDGTVDVEEETYPVMSNELMAMMYGDAGPKGHALMRQRLCSNLVGCMGMTVMLMSKGVTTQHKPAPDKLNKMRDRLGKPRINDSYSVLISSGDVRNIATSDGEQSIAGHIRGAPRLHWRRGHFRTLERGSDRQRVVPVAPALIGGNEAADSIRKSYEVRS